MALRLKVISPGPVAGSQRAAVNERVEDRDAGAERADRRNPPGDRATGQPRRTQPPRHEHRDDRAAQHHDVGVPAERSGLQRRETSQPHPGPAPGARLSREHRPQQGPGTRRDQRGFAEGRHVITPREQDGRAGGAVQPDGGHATEPAEPAPAAEIQAQAGQRAIEERSQPDDAERLERHREVWVARVLLADPPAARQLHPLDEAATRARTQPVMAHLRRQLPGERVRLRLRQGEEVPVGHRHDRGTIGVIVRLGKIRRGPEHQHAQRHEGGCGQACRGNVPTGIWPLAAPHPQPVRVLSRV